MMIGPADFVGQWRLTRQIDDRRAGATGHMEGQATFTPIGHALRYFEEGQLRLGDGPMLEAQRIYLWDFDGEEVAMRFEDGRAFHRFRPAGLSPGTEHPCGDDLYRVEYDFTAWPIWSATWEVSGPRKDYTFVSRYSRD